MVKFEHYRNSGEIFHDSNNIIIVLNIIKSSVSYTCMCEYTIGTPGYIKE